MDLHKNLETSEGEHAIRLKNRDLKNFASVGKMKLQKEYINLQNIPIRGHIWEGKDDAILNDCTAKSCTALKDKAKCVEIMQIQWL